MAKQTINVGATANDKQGDSLRAAFQKVNANFTELYTALGLNSDGTLNLGAFEFVGSTMSTTDSTPIVIDQAVTVNSDLTVGGDVLPSVANGANLGSLLRPFKSLYVSNSTVYFGGIPLTINQLGQLTVNGSQVGGSVAWNDVTGKPTIPSVGDFTFANSTVTAGNEDEITVQARDINGFATARLSLEPVYSNAQLSAYSAETVETFTLANGDFATGVWQNNGFGNGVVAFTGAQNIGDFFQNILSNLTAANVSITINSEPAIPWNGGFSGAGTSTPGFGTNPTVPVSPITITSIVFRYRSQSFVSVNQDNSEIRLKAQNATIRMDADLDIRMFADSQIEIQSGDTLSISAGENISISTASSDTVSISTGDLNITAFDDVDFRGSDSFRIRNTSASAPIRIVTDGNNTSQTWSFGADGILTLPGTGTIRTAFGAMSINAPTGSSNLSIKSSDATTYMIVGNGSAGVTAGSYNWQFSNTGNLTFPDSTVQTTAWTGNFGYLTADKDTIRGTAGYQYTFNTDGYFTGSTSSESTNYFFVTYNATNTNIAAGWTVVGGTANTTVSSVTYPVAGYPGVIRVNLTAAASSTSGFYPVTVTSPDRLRVEIQPNPGTSDKFAFTTSDLILPNGLLTLTSNGYIKGSADQNVNVQTSYNTIVPGQTISAIDAQNGPTNDWISIFISGSGLANYPEIVAVQPGWTVTGTGLTNEPVTQVEQVDLGSGVVIYKIYTAISSTKGGFTYTFTEPATTVNTTKIWAFSDRGDLTIPGDIKSQGNINIDINLSDSTLRRWQFGEDGNLNLAGHLQFPNGAEIRDVNGDLRLRAAPGDVAQLQGLDTNGSVDSSVKAFYDNGSFVTINTNIDAGAPEHIWTFDYNGKLTLPGILELSNGAQIFNTAGIDNSITIGATGTNGTTTFNGSGFFNGDVYFNKAIQEKFSSLQDATGVVTHDCANGHIFYHTSPDANWTINLTNFSLITNYATAITIIISQGGTGYYPSALQIGGAAQTINWQGNTNPTPSSNRVDVVTFSIFLTGGGYTVLGQLTGF